MFNTARLKLTTWYLLIIMTISLSFSLVIYKVLTHEVERFSRMQRFRIERRLHIANPPSPLPILTDPDLVNETKRRILLLLGEINLVILLFSGGLGYFLAGRTLKPIVDMVDEQNRFVSDASHELRTPLTALKTSIEVNLRDKNLNLDQAKKILANNVEEVNKLQSLSDNLLDLAQTQTANNHQFHKAISLNKPINEAIKKITPLAKQKKIIIKKKLIDCQIKGDETSLTNLFVILLDNAVKYSLESGLVEITTKKTDKSIIITITDNGKGIDKKDLPRIFDRFYRADSARTKEGYGLGLSIAKKIVSDHHGSIKVTSQLKKGASVQLNFSLV